MANTSSAPTVGTAEPQHQSVVPADHQQLQWQAHAPPLPSSPSPSPSAVHYHQHTAQHNEYHIHATNIAGLGTGADGAVHCSDAKEEPHSAPVVSAASAPATAAPAPSTPPQPSALSAAAPVRSHPQHGASTKEAMEAAEWRRSAESKEQPGQWTPPPPPSSYSTSPTSTSSPLPSHNKKRRRKAAAGGLSILSQAPWFELVTVEALRAEHPAKWWTFHHISTSLIATVAQYVCYTDWTKQVQTGTIALVFILAIPYAFGQGYHHLQPPPLQAVFNVMALLLHLPIIVAAYETVDWSFRLCISVLLALWLLSVVWHALVKRGAVRVLLRTLVEVWYSVTFVHLIFRFVPVSPLPLVGVVAAFYVRLVLFARALLSTEPAADIDRLHLIRRLMRGIAWTQLWWLPPEQPHLIEAAAAVSEAAAVKVEHERTSLSLP